LRVAFLSSEEDGFRNGRGGGQSMACCKAFWQASASLTASFADIFFGFPGRRDEKSKHHWFLIQAKNGQKKVSGARDST
jgi:hypothetical protein